MAVELCPLFSLEKQFQAKNGANNTNGFLKVFLAGTDDPANTYSDYVGTLNPQKIVLDDNGRAVVICDKAKAYRLEVYDADGMLLWTEEPKYCTGNGGGGVSVTRVISTDGSISVDESVVGSQHTYDIGIAPADSDEFLEWAKCVDEDVPNGITYPTFVDGSMETEAGKGLHVGKDRFYHITASFRVYPSGTGISYESLTTELKFNDGNTTSLLIRRTYDIDNSLHDSVMCEFSYDFKAPADGYLFFQLDNVTTFHDVAIVMQVHRIYSGVNAVPDSCATKQWVQETFDNMSGKIGYSALEYNGNSQITGISGSAIATTDPSLVSSIASSYAESAVSSISAWSGYFSSISSKADQSALEQCCDEVHSALDEKMDASASSQFQPSGDYAFVSSLSAYVEKTAYSAFSSEVTNNISSLSSTVSGLTGQYIEQSASGMFAPSGNYVSASDMSAYVPFSGLEGDGTKITGISGSAIKGHEYTGISPVVVDNVADTISVEHRTLCVDSTMTAYNSGSSAVIGVNVEGLNLSSKMDASASSLFYSTSNPSGFVDSSYVDSAVSGKLDTTAFSTVSGDFLTSHQSLAGYATESWVSGELSSKLDVTASSQFITALPDDLATTSDVASAVSGKLDASASSEFYPMTENPSGYLTAHQSLAGLATESYVDSSVSGKLDTTAYDSAKFQLTADMSAYQLSGDYAFNSALTAYQLIADMSAYQPSGDYTYNSALSSYQLTADMSAYQLSGDYAYNSSLADKLDASASSDFQLTADMSGYYTTANESGFITGVDLTPYQTTAGMTAYQEVSGMTAYQPVGVYIYESALGWAEV